MTQRQPQVAMRPVEKFLYGVAGAAAMCVAFAVLLMLVVNARNIGVKPAEMGWLIASAWVAMSLARSRGEHFAWLVPLLGSTALLATLVVPALQEYRAAGHAAMVSVLIVTAVQLHRCLVREFRNAEV
jgi:hypothetical protein